MALLGKNPTIKNLTLTTQDTEYSYALPNGTKKFEVQCRTDNEVKIAYVEEESGSNFRTIPEGATKAEDNLNTSHLILYFQSPTAGVVVEIESWRTD